MAIDTAPSRVAKGFGDGELSFPADGHNLHLHTLPVALPSISDTSTRLHTGAFGTPIYRL